MFLALVVCQIALIAATPFHKYPYVFLLDVGNEEIKKTNSEQIRLSVPGGSLALRYPAVGTGDTIAHVRVSGIDFGTDLKANIIDGGPGYKYVVLVFMGNQGVPYDAVMTVQTVSDEDIDDNQSDDMSNGYNDYKVTVGDDNSAEVTSDNSDQVKNIVDENVSAEDMDDESYSNVENKNAQITQKSSNIYSYANNEDDNDDSNNKYAINEYVSNDENTNQITQESSKFSSYVNSANDYDDANDDNDTTNEEDDGSYNSNDRYKNAQYTQQRTAYSYSNSENDYEDDDTSNLKDIHKQYNDENFDQQQNNDVEDEISDQYGISKPETSDSNDDYGNENTYDKENESFRGVDSASEKYQQVMPLRVYDGLRVYPQYAVPFALPNSDNSGYSTYEGADSDHTVNDDDKYRDSNNNYFDSHDPSAIAS